LAVRTVTRTWRRATPLPPSFFVIPQKRLDALRSTVAIRRERQQETGLCPLPFGGPVIMPPWSLHLPPFPRPRHRQGVPSRVRAPQRVASSASARAFCMVLARPAFRRCRACALIHSLISVLTLTSCGARARARVRVLKIRPTVTRAR
jgi:hypothetical protein